MIQGTTGSRPTGAEAGLPLRWDPGWPDVAVSEGEPPVEWASAWPVPEADRFTFDVVETVVGLVPPGTPPLRLQVTVDAAGVDLAGSPTAPGLVPWSSVRGVWLGPPLAPEQERVVTPLDLVWVGGSARLLLPGDRIRSVDLVALEARLVTWAPPSGPDPARAALPGQVVTPPPWAAPVPWALTPPGAPAFPPPPGSGAFPPPARKRRRAALVVGLALILAGVALAVGLPRHTVRDAVRPRPAAPTVSPDQQLADRIMLTRNDLPVGWTIDRSAGASADSPGLRTGEAAITRTFASCMGITAAQAAVVLGGRAADQTAQSSSPLFEAPASTAHPGLAVELQTAAVVVHSHQDEQRDLALFSAPTYPACAATATAAELQLGVDTTSGSHGRPGPATPTVVSFPAVDGERLVALSVACVITDGTAAVPVEVTSVVVGSDRVEADLQAFAIGGPVPDDILHSSVAAFVQRVASGGRSVQI